MKMNHTGCTRDLFGMSTGFCAKGNSLVTVINEAHEEGFGRGFSLYSSVKLRGISRVDSYYIGLTPYSCYQIFDCSC